MVSQMLWWTPQYAYVEGKAIDEAGSRVARDCSLARDVPGQAIALYTVHDKRRGALADICAGGVQLSVDLPQAVDLLPGPVLEASLQRLAQSTTSL